MTSRFPALLLAMLVSGSVHAAGNSLNPILDDAWTFRLGATYIDSDGTFSSTIDGEQVDKLQTDDLDLSDRHVSPYLGVRWRFTDRWRAMFSYFGMETEGSVREDFDRLLFGIIDASGFLQVDSTFSTDFYVAQVGYSFLKNERGELGVGGGLHVVDFETKLKVSAGLNGRSGSRQTDSSDLTVPLPNLLGFGTYAFSPRWSLDGSIGWFGLDYDDYSGHLAVLAANLEYRITEKLGVGLGYNYVDMNLDIEDGRRTDTYDLDYNGPVLYLSMGF